VALVLSGFALSCFMPVSCGARVPMTGQFGPYHDINKLLRLPSGDTITVYRVKYWVFSNGEPPALQLEYASHVPTSDTAAVLAADRVIWPSFAPYLEHLHLKSAILTATILARSAGGAISTRRSWGTVLIRDETGAWFIRGHPDVLPPADTSSTPRIIDGDGKPLAFMTTPPTGSNQ
jgi:hypothetical protein